MVKPIGLIILIDTGLPDQYDVVKDELNQVGFRMDQVTEFLITHHDLDEGMRSIKKIADFDIQKAIVFQGGWIQSNDLPMQLHKLEGDYFKQKKT
jgi:hypothetical protein